jgi:carbon-monoxide dehydrogenase medium subunit
MLALRLARFDHLVDLNRIPELQHITQDHGWLSIGAMTRQTTAEHSPLVEHAAPLLARALPHIGHFQIRNRGTIGGSIAHADPASEIPAIAVALGATIEVRGHGGARLIEAEDFFLSFWQTAVAPDELVVSVRLPEWGPRSGFGFEEFALRHGDFAIAGAACAVHLDAEGAVDRAGLSLMGMGPTPVRAGSASEAMIGNTPDEIDLAAVAASAISETQPGDDIHASASYRRTVAAQLITRAVRAALEEAARA